VDAAPDGGTVTALIQMQALNDAYLLVVRLVDPQVFGYYRRTLDAVSEYNRLDENRAEVQLVFAALYAVVSLVTLLAAVWSGIWAANRLVRPISNLIDAAERVSEGDLTAQVKVARDDDEIGTLGHAFNRMTQQLGAQRGDLSRPTGRTRNAGGSPRRCSPASAPASSAWIATARSPSSIVPPRGCSTPRRKSWRAAIIPSRFPNWAR